MVRHLNDTVETVIGKLAFSAHGLVRRTVLLRAGITQAEIRSRLTSGALLREYPGVYRVGHRAPSLESHYLAAVWACGAGALLSGQAAGHLQGLLKGGPPPPEAIAPGPRRIQGLVTRRYRSIAADDVTNCRGIPVTSVPRTLVDLAAVLNEQQLARACHEAGVRYGTTPAQVEEVLRRRPTAPGAGKLRAVMRGDAKVVLSKLEERFLGLLREARLTLPETNRPAGGRRVDCRWPEYRLTAELDSYTYHNSRASWEADRRRERDAYARGDEFRRFSRDDVFKRPRLLVAELRPLLSAQRVNQVSPGDT